VKTFEAKKQESNRNIQVQHSNCNNRTAAIELQQSSHRYRAVYSVSRGQYYFTQLISFSSLAEQPGLVAARDYAALVRERGRLGFSKQSHVSTVSGVFLGSRRIRRRGVATVENQYKHSLCLESIFHSSTSLGSFSNPLSSKSPRVQCLFPAIKSALTTFPCPTTIPSFSTLTYTPSALPS